MKGEESRKYENFEKWKIRKNCYSCGQASTVDARGRNTNILVTNVNDDLRRVEEVVPQVPERSKQAEVEQNSLHERRWRSCEDILYQLRIGLMKERGKFIAI